MNKFYLNQKFRADGVTAKVISIKEWNQGLLAGTQVVLVMINEDPGAIYRTVKWPGGEMYRMTRVDIAGQMLV